MVTPKDYRPSDWVEEDDTHDPGADNALEMLGGLLLAVVVILMCVGIYFLFTRVIV